MDKADNILASLHYRSKAALPFVDFRARLNLAYRLKHEAGVPVNNRQKLANLLKQIKCQEQNVLDAMKTIQDHRFDDPNYPFKHAMARLNSEISHAEPARAQTV